MRGPVQAAESYARYGSRLQHHRAGALQVRDDFPQLSSAAHARMVAGARCKAATAAARRRRQQRREQQRGPRGPLCRCLPVQPLLVWVTRHGSACDMLACAADTALLATGLSCPGLLSTLPTRPPAGAERTVYKDNLFDRAMIYYFSKVMSDQLGGESWGARVYRRADDTWQPRLRESGHGPRLAAALPNACMPPARLTTLSLSCCLYSAGIPFDGSWNDFVNLSREIMRGRNSREQQETVAGVLAGLLPPQVRICVLDGALCNSWDQQEPVAGVPAGPLHAQVLS